MRHMVDCTYRECMVFAVLFLYHAPVFIEWLNIIDKGDIVQIAPSILAAVED